MSIEVGANTLVDQLGGELVIGTDPFGVICVGATTDSRAVNKGTIFFARHGENTDGHKFIPEACLAGATVVVCEKQWVRSGGYESLINLHETMPAIVIAVDDSTTAYGKLAHYWRQYLNIPTIAITGSAGKTTTKEICASLLNSLVGPGTASKKSYNNHIGLPDTILQASVGDKWMVLEAGMNHEGELSELSRISCPDVAAILNIGPVHLEHFGSLKNIALAKCEIFRSLAPDGRAIISGDDNILREAFGETLKESKNPFPQRFYGFLPKCDFVVKHIRSCGLGGEELEITFNGQSVRSNIPHLGVHNCGNACAASAIVITEFPDIKLGDVAECLPAANNAPMRLETISCGRLTVINDCYNANPLSMAAAIKVVKNLAGDRNFALVIGDMLELGEAAEHYHYELGVLCGKSGANFIWLYGNYSEIVLQGALAGGHQNCVAVRSFTELVDDIASKDLLDFVLFKASRGVALEKAVELLKEKKHVISSPISTKCPFLSS